MRRAGLSASAELLVIIIVWFILSTVLCPTVCGACSYYLLHIVDIADCCSDVSLF